MLKSPRFCRVNFCRSLVEENQRLKDEVRKTCQLKEKKTFAAAKKKAKANNQRSDGVVLFFSKSFKSFMNGKIPQFWSHLEPMLFNILRLGNVPCVGDPGICKNTSVTDLNWVG